jgi:3D (Asp-Asp-Asp) domain-containing protein
MRYVSVVMINVFIALIFVPTVSAQNNTRSGHAHFWVTYYTCPPYCGKTASGTQVRPGVIAVDPTVIAIGSTVIIEGLGTFTAEDTGSNVRGHIIDVFVSLEQAATFQNKKRLAHWYQKPIIGQAAAQRRQKYPQLLLPPDSAERRNQPPSLFPIR